MNSYISSWDEAIGIMNSPWLNPLKKGEYIHDLGICQFCVLAFTGKLKSLYDSQVAHRRTCNLSDPKCERCKIRKPEETQNYDF